MKIQILLSCPNAFLIEEVGEIVEISRKFIMGDHELNSYDLSV